MRYQCSVVLLLASSLTPLAAQESRPTSNPAPTQPDPEPPPATAPKPVRGSDEALALARQVRDFAGGEAALSQVKHLVFTFAGSRRLFWSLAEQKVRVENLAPAPGPGVRGQHWEVLVYDHGAGEDLLRSPPKPHPQAPNLSARSMWINDTYWLLVPLKVLDDGVVLSIDPRGDDDPEGVARLRLAFDGVGITPKDQYVLHVETATGKVLRWDYWRDPKRAPASWRFEGWTQLGPVRLALSHPPVDEGARGARSIELSDVVVNGPVPEAVWTSTERILAGTEDR
jgi:hypothetical protein